MFSGSLVPIATPMRPDGSLDFAAWAKLLDFHAANGTSGVVVGGTTGESTTITETELMQLLERARAQLRGRAASLLEPARAVPRLRSSGSGAWR